MNKPVITRDLDILGGVPVFAGTRVPVRVFIDHLEAGDRLDEFLEDYPSVTKEQAIGVLEMAMERLSRDDEAAA